nr:SDR family oxidoreductase [Saccharothrix sp. ALI-22-I]
MHPQAGAVRHGRPADSRIVHPLRTVRHEHPRRTGMTGLTPAGRFVSPEELTGLVVYLAGPESGYLTGATINIDGGYTV